MCLRVLSSMFNMWIHIKERQKRKKDKKGFVLETKKKKSASMRVQIKPDQLGADRPRQQRWQ